MCAHGSSTTQYEPRKPLMDKNKNSNLQTIEGFPLPVEIKRHAKARRITLRVHTTKARIVITMPRRASVKESLSFLKMKKDWVLGQIDKQPAKDDIKDGSVISILGEELHITHVPSARGSAWIEDGKLFVSGAAEFLPRRVRDFLKAHAKKILSDMARDAAMHINKSITRVDVRDMHSRWGSCSSDGRVCFSWRLILAPKHVCEYVVAHEVAHLKHLDHSAAFWNVVDDLHADKEIAQAWLRKNGQKLFLI